MQDTFARATHSANAAGRPSAARDDRVSCIQGVYRHGRSRNIIITFLHLNQKFKKKSND